MPKAMEIALKREAKKKGLTGERADAYVYGTLRKTGWIPSTQKKSRTGMYDRYAKQRNKGAGE